jgi:hypothetical protein
MEKYFDVSRSAFSGPVGVESAQDGKDFFNFVISYRFRDFFEISLLPVLKEQCKVMIIFLTTPNEE